MLFRDIAHLDLSQNQLSARTLSFLFLFGSLKSINLGHNRITDLPDFSRFAQTLERLDISHNDVASIDDIWRTLPNLKVLRCTACPIADISIPSAVPVALEELDLSGTRLKLLPAAVYQLPRLRTLDISRTSITALPADITKLRSLHTLRLRGCGVSSFPSSVTELAELRVLDVRDTLLAIPLEIANAPEDGQRIIRYLQGDSQPLNEAKVLFVGEGEVGKTSLIRSLIDTSKDTAAQVVPNAVTKGIERYSLNISTSGSNVHFNLWDFGGQEILHATHQFFLTKRSIYVIVLNSRSGEHASRLEYWLRTIENFAPDAPIIVACNKCDEAGLEINKNGLRSKHKQIVDIIERVSCANDAREGIEEVRAAIAKCVAKLKHVGDRLPTAFLQMKRRLEAMNYDYVSFDDYQRLCVEHGIVDLQQQSDLIDLLHDLGVVLYFRDDPVLSETSVRNPNWVTKGIYLIISSFELRDASGLLDERMLPKIFSSPETRTQYPKEKHSYLLKMMRRFELAFDTSEGKGAQLFVPALLSKSEPDTGDWTDSLKLVVEYHVLLPAIMSRFIVRTHLQASAKTFWRDGIVLKRTNDNGEQNRAIVRADPDEDTISIMVSGDPRGRREFLCIIRETLLGINRSVFNEALQGGGVPFEERVPVADQRGVTVSYAHLRRLESQGELYYQPEGSNRRYAVHELLDSVDTIAARFKKQTSETASDGSDGATKDWFTGRAQSSTDAGDGSGSEKVTHNVKTVALAFGAVTAPMLVVVLVLWAIAYTLGEGMMYVVIAGGMLFGGIILIVGLLLVGAIDQASFVLLCQGIFNHLKWSSQTDAAPTNPQSKNTPPTGLV